MCPATVKAGGDSAFAERRNIITTNHPRLRVCTGKGSISGGIVPAIAALQEKTAEAEAELKVGLQISCMLAAVATHGAIPLQRKNNTHT